MYYCGEGILIEIECFIVHPAQYLHSASGCPTLIKAVAHQQAGWYVITFLCSGHTLHYLIYPLTPSSF